MSIQEMNKKIYFANLKKLTKENLKKYGNFLNWDFLNYYFLDCIIEIKANSKLIVLDTDKFNEIKNKVTSKKFLDNQPIEKFIYYFWK